MTPVITFPNPTGLKPKSCNVCGKKVDLKRCSGCQSVYYCGPDHQVADRPQHKSSCTMVKKCRANYEREERELREQDVWGWGPDIFENGAGKFWGIYETRSYMQARFQLVDSLMRSYGDQGACWEVVQTCLGHLQDMMRLCRGDNMGLRDIIVGMYIRLGNDQDAYDFMKWYATTGTESDYDWGDMSLPFLDVKDADIFEEPEAAWCKVNFLQLSHASAVTLIKIRILHDLQAMQNAFRALKGTLPLEIVAIVQNHLVGTRIPPKTLNAGEEEVAKLIKKMEAQIKKLYTSIDRYNPHYWMYMTTNPRAAANDRPGSYGFRTPEEARLVVGYNWVSWEETPNSIKTIKAISAVV